MSLTPELKALEMEIFKKRNNRRIKNIREAFAAYCRSLEGPKNQNLMGKIWEYFKPAPMSPRAPGDEWRVE